MDTHDVTVPVSVLTAQLAVAIAEYEAGRSALASTIMQDLYRTCPDDARPAWALGTLLCNESRFAEAIAPLERVIALEPDNGVARAYLALAHLRGRYEVEQAQVQMLRAVELAPQSFVVRWKYGELLLRLGYAREAADQLRVALAADAPSAASRDACTELLRLAERRGIKQHNRIAPQLPAFRLPQFFRRLFTTTAVQHPAPKEA